MSDKYRIPDYKKIYPEASDEVIAVLRHTERKMQYQEYDLKTGDYEINQKEETVTYFPAGKTHWNVCWRQNVNLAMSSHLLKRK